MKFDTELTMSKPFGPWMLRGKLPKEILDKMIKITDKITDDARKINAGPGLVGIIDDEPWIPPETLKDEGVFEFFTDLGSYFIRESMDRIKLQDDRAEVIFSGGYGSPSTKKTPVQGDESTEVRPNLKIELDSMWIVNQKQHEYNPAHLHTNATVSSVMYLKIPEVMRKRNIVGKQETDGRIEFIYGASGEVWKTFDPGTMSILPEVGDIFMWPSDLLHTVYPFIGEGIRRSVSYNLRHEFLPPNGTHHIKPGEETITHQKEAKVISMEEARLQTKVELLEDKLNKLQDKK
tara:strand:- start:573 stop:1445 length:873 start_codon:yes stop_codon:yes gene_type:complete